MLLHEIAAPKYPDGERNPKVPDEWELLYDGTTVFVKISPYVWMRSGKGKTETGYSISLIDGGPNISREFLTMPVSYYSNTKSAINKEIKAYLKKNGLDPLKAAAGSWDELQGDMQKSQTKRDAEDKAADKKAQDSGFKFRIDAVVEPSRGDDYTVSWYSVERPSKDDVKKELRKRKSDSFDNYRVVAL